MTGFSDVESGDIHNIMTVGDSDNGKPRVRHDFLIRSEVGLSPQATYKLVFEAAVKDGLEISHLYHGVRVYDTGSSIAFMAALAGYSAAGRRTIPMFRGADGTHSHMRESPLAELGFTVRSDMTQIFAAIQEHDPEIQKLLKKRLQRIA